MPSTEATFSAFAQSLAIGMPLSVYANVQEVPDIIVISAIVSVIVGLVICIVSGTRDKLSELQRINQPTPEVIGAEFDYQDFETPREKKATKVVSIASR